MTDQELKQLKALLVVMGAYYGQELLDSVVTMYAEDLKDLSFEDVNRALTEYRRDPKNTRCPLPAMIRARIEPDSNPESEAIFISNLIVQAISRVGPYQLPDLPWVAKEIIKMEGGWENVCDLATNDNIGMLKAQWRGLAKTLIERKSRTDRTLLPPPNSETIRIESMVKGILKEMPKP